MPKETVYKPSKQPKESFLGGGLKPPEFIPSYYEWLSTKGKLIVKSATTGTQGTSTLYTIPQGNTFYLTNIIITVCNSSTTQASRTAWIKIGDDILTAFTYNSNAEGRTNYSFNIPIKVMASIIIRYNPANCQTNFMMMGFLVANKDIPTL